VNRTILSIAAILGCAVSLSAQDYSKFAFNIGGGVSAPLNPTAKFAGVSGNFDTGAGYNITRHHALLGEFMWSGLPPNFSTLQPVNAPFGNINLYSLTANYRYQADRLSGSRFGVYLIGGGGWYYRRATVDKNYIAPPGTACQPIYTWWGYGCTANDFVYTATIASRGVSAGGLNAGAGFTIRLADSGFKFYVESRYHYAFSHIPSTLVPVTFGFRYN